MKNIIKLINMADRDRLTQIFHEVGTQYRDALQEILVSYTETGDFNIDAINHFFYLMNYVIRNEQMDNEVENEVVVTRLLNESRILRELGDPDDWPRFFLQYMRQLRIRSSRNPMYELVGNFANTDTELYAEQVRETRRQRRARNAPGAHRIPYDPRDGPRYELVRRDGEFVLERHYDYPAPVQAEETMNVFLPAALPLTYELANPVVHEDTIFLRDRLPEEIVGRISSYLPQEQLGILERGARYIQPAYGEVAPVVYMEEAEDDDDAEHIYAVDERGVRAPPRNLRRRGQAYRSQVRSREEFWNRIYRR